MERLYVLRHRELGPIGCYLTPYEAGRAMAMMLLDEPERLDDVWLEPFDVTLAREALPRHGGPSTLAP